MGDIWLSNGDLNDHSSSIWNLEGVSRVRAGEVIGSARIWAGHLLLMKQFDHSGFERGRSNYVAQIKRSGIVRFRQSQREQTLCFNGNPFDVAATLTSGLLIGKRKQCLAGLEAIAGEGRSERIGNISKHGRGVS
jgi:hypothetical protein